MLALQHTLRSLRGVARNLDPDGGKPRFRITGAHMRSPFSLTLAGEQTQHEVVRPYLRGVRALSHAETLPPGFDIATARTVQQLASIPIRFKTGPLIYVSPTEGEVVVNLEIAANIDKIVGPERQPYEEWTTLSGLMDKAGVRSGGEFEVKDRLTGSIIECRFERTALLSKVKEGLACRVEISGLAEFNELAEPVSMFVEHLDVLDAGPLPTVEDLMDFDFTGGIDHADFVMDLRDDE